MERTRRQFEDRNERDQDKWIQMERKNDIPKEIAKTIPVSAVNQNTNSCNDPPSEDVYRWIHIKLH